MLRCVKCHWKSACDTHRFPTAILTSYDSNAGLQRDIAHPVTDNFALNVMQGQRDLCGLLKVKPNFDVSTIGAWAMLERDCRAGRSPWN